jgi:hypothetical protein
LPADLLFALALLLLLPLLVWPPSGCSKHMKQRGMHKAVRYRHTKVQEQKKLQRKLVCSK